METAFQQVQNGPEKDKQARKSRISPLVFPLLQLSEAKARRSVFPAAISPASFLSDCLRVVGEGDGSGNRRAVVHRVGRRLPRSRVCSLVLMAELGFAGGEGVFLCGVVV
jgi:hypothetical protein